MNFVHRNPYPPAKCFAKMLVTIAFLPTEMEVAVGRMHLVAHRDKCAKQSNAIRSTR